MKEQSLETIAQVLYEKDNFIIVSHLNPDGDSVGSVLALGQALQVLGKKVILSTIDSVPFKYAFLPESNIIKKWQEIQISKENYIITLDCSDLKRIYPLEGNLLKEQLINIDHHVSNQYFGSYNYVDPDASSVGEIIFELLEIMNINITLNIALCLYTAIITDTGSFCYSNTTSKTHRTAAQLLEIGVDPAEISHHIYENYPKSSVFLVREALNTLEFTCQDKISYITITEDMMERAGAKDEETEGIINYTRNIQGVEIGILFREVASDRTRVGFRSHRIDVGQLAELFNGGGHPRASGCEIDKSLRETKDIILDKARIFLNEYQPETGD
ncbi:MAG: bifunctional oligoribonuclease/PAP phosphatase NrnA [Candidatus Syntrophonatronum acetioxidans]|uniref:Bifunctional oligoribonuclease/PAP phosphatase NrnA n=1 Tax=Candidatus Syntrophonatronum acetioxidans TaxID=1795816 RepID=A0A424YDW4_9FIRM|nr:MAG: bifunctional oligoribonuclease/PAP phosphatase NrnA [Candidatus Syntrophonatronum acetioxidans]